MTELGGDGANIVFADADLDQAVGAVINAFVYNTGQFCMSGTRLLVESAAPRHDRRHPRRRGPARPARQPERPPAPSSARSSARSSACASSASSTRRRRTAARSSSAGEPLDLDGGFYYPPTIITGLPNDSEAIQEEIFGPVLTVQPFDTEEEAIELANSTRYGLAAGVQTSDFAKAIRVTSRLQAGVQWVNGWAMLDPSVPFGGYKDSGLGRESGPEALINYTRAKSVTISVPPAP